MTLDLVCNGLSGAYFVTAAGSIFNNRLLQTLESSAANIDSATVLATGASEIHHVFGGRELAAVVDAYMVGMKDVFAFSLAGAAFTIIIALMVPFKKLPLHDKRKEGDKNEATEKA